MSTLPVECSNCLKLFRKDVREVNRAARLNKMHFCSLACTARYYNATRRNRAIEKICPYCLTTFVGSTGSKAKTYCSHRCATLASDTPARRFGRSLAGSLHIENLKKPFETLRIREHRRYEDLRMFLEDRPHEFEFPLGKYVFDLALLDTMTLVEFDSPYHKYGNQPAIDRRKDKLARHKGFRVVRIEVPVSVERYSPDLIRTL